MFIRPVSGATIADALVLYLRITFHDLLYVKATFSVGNTYYLAPLAIVRLLLILPLIYHTYTGTRVKFPIAYFSFHSFSAVVLLVHIIVFITVTHDGNLNTIWYNTKEQFVVELSEEETSTSSDIEYGFEQFGNTLRMLIETNLAATSNATLVAEFPDQFKVTRILLLLSLISIFMHIVILLHVRSSAPSSGFVRPNTLWKQYRRKDRRQRKQLSYWIYHKYRRQHEKEIADGNANDECFEDLDNGNRSPLFGGNLLVTSSALFADENESLFDFESARSHEEYDSACSIEEASCFDETQAFLPNNSLMDGTNVAELRGEMPRQRKKRDIDPGARWGNRGGVNFRNFAGIQACFTDGYDEFLSEIRIRFQEAKQEWKERLDEVTDRVQQQTGTGKFLLQLNQQTPFQALLYLYAHEDVFTNNQLDRAFSNNDDHLALSFYAPQLLVFLLHNAYLNTGRLEKWLLEKCSKNLQFSHRCFWFLRAWCLQGEVSNIEDDALEVDSEGTSKVGSERLSHNKQSESCESINSKLDNWATNIPINSSFDMEGDNNIEDNKTVSSFSSILSFKHSNKKFASEERQLMENLLRKVIECGEDAVRKLEYGPTGDGDNCDIPPIESSPLQDNDLISTHQHAHLNASPNPQVIDTIVNFHQTTDFLDRLIKIADDLMKQPQSTRTTELRQQLKQLEVDMLPSNSIYVPVNNSMHRVWRIVTSESIALSTKERVPCIVTLEVIDHYSSKTQSRTKNSKKRNNKEGIPLSNWYKLPRRAQRHNTFLSKAQKQLQKLRHDITDSIQQQDEVFDEIADTTSDELRSIPSASDVPSSLILNADSDIVTSTVLKSAGDGGDIENQRKTFSASPHLIGSTSQFLQPSIAKKSCRPSYSTKLGQWLNAAQAGSFNDSTNKFSISALQEYLPGENKTADWSTAKTSISEVHFKTDGEGDTSAITLSEAKMQELERSPPFSLEEDEMLVSKSEKKNSRKHRRRRNRSTAASNRSPPIVFKEDWQTKQKRLRSKSAYGTHSNWRLLPILIKSNDDLRQEQLASQLIHCMASILSQANVPVWLYPYEIVALTFRGGVIECIPDTVSIDSLRKNHPNFTDLKAFIEQQFGPPGCDEYENAKANFVESLSAYSIVCFLLQVKDRHNGNILLDNKGHLIHIDFGFFFLSSPGKNSGFESAPFKLTREFVDMMDGANSHTFSKFRELCYKTFLELRKNCFQITLLVQMLMEGNEDLDCFRDRPDEAVAQLSQRFRLELNDRACLEYVNALIDESLENWTTTCYDRYQRFCVGVM